MTIFCGVLFRSACKQVSGSAWKAFVALAASALLLGACGGGGGGGEACTPKGASSATATQTVKVVPDPSTVGAFDPKAITVKAGQAVEWDWQDPNVQHSVTSDDATTFDSCLQSSGSKFVVTLNTPGSISYHCIIHAGMVGTITVTS